MKDYQRKITLADKTPIQLRAMNRKDRDAVLAFAKALPAEDLLFLRVDLTEPDVVDNWIANLEAGNSTSIAAFDGDEFIGYATVHTNRAHWTRHVGEIRVNVAPAFRTRGLGRVLISEIFDIARDQGLKKLMANMTVDQRGAQAAFRRLGFVVEAMMADFVQDAEGNYRDMIIMSFDIDGHSQQVDAPVKI